MSTDSGRLVQWLAVLSRSGRAVYPIAYSVAAALVLGVDDRRSATDVVRAELRLISRSAWAVNGYRTQRLRFAAADMYFLLLEGYKVCAGDMAWFLHCTADAVFGGAWRAWRICVHAPADRPLAAEHTALLQGLVAALQQEPRAIPALRGLSQSEQRALAPDLPGSNGCCTRGDLLLAVRREMQAMALAGAINLPAPTAVYALPPVPAHAMRPEPTPPPALSAASSSEPTPSPNSTPAKRSRRPLDPSDEDAPRAVPEHASLMDRAAASVTPNMFPGFPWLDGAGTGAFAGLRDLMQLALADYLSSNAPR